MNYYNRRRKPARRSFGFKKLRQTLDRVAPYVERFFLTLVNAFVQHLLNRHGVE